MSEQFSKLNKFGHSITSKNPINLAKNLSNKKPESTSKPTFTLGDRDIAGNSTGKSNNSSSSNSSNEDIKMDPIRMEKPDNYEHDKKLMEGYTPTIGIIMGVKNDAVIETNQENKSNLDHLFGNNQNNFSENARQNLIAGGLTLIPHSQSGSNVPCGSHYSMFATTPEITIQDVEGATDDKEKNVPPSSLNLPKNISHSSGEVDGQVVSTDSKNSTLQTDNRVYDKKRSTSEQDLVLSISSSQSESALKSIRADITSVTSPVASTTKDILSPFSKFAKGVQNLGANLDPRKLKPGQTGMARNLSEHHLEQREKLQERWVKCRSKLIAL